MGDIAQILGVTAVATSEAKLNVPLPKSKTSQFLPKQTIDAITFTKGADYDSANLPPIVPEVVRVSNRLILSQKKARPWCWAPFASNARNDGLLLHHWVRAGVEYPEYPFARFNIHLDPLSFDDIEDSDQFYREHLHDDNWTQSETETLLELCKTFELRWPVIADRWIGKFGRLSNKKVEDLQHRYYTIGMVLNRRLVHKAAKVEAENLAKALSSTSAGGLISSSSTEPVLNKHTLPAEHALATVITNSSSVDVASLVGDVTSGMQPLITSTNTGTSNQATFDLEMERQRRNILDLIWKRSKEDELEEEALREELKLIEAQLRKLKKSGGYLISGTSTLPARGPSPNPASGGDAVTGMDINASRSVLDAQFSSSAPTPTPGVPYMQSGRLAQPAVGGHLGINKSTLKKMDLILNELSVKERPLPTNRVCDMYDHVRKGALTLLALQKMMLKKESEVVSKRLKLEKVAGATAAKSAAAKAEAAAAAASAAAALLAAENAKKEKEAAAEKKSKAPPKGGGSSKPKSEEGETKKKSAKKKAPIGDKPAGESKKRKAPAKKTTGNDVTKAENSNASSNALLESSSPGNKKAKTSS